MRYATSPNWLLLLVFSLLINLMAGLCLVWMSIERTSNGYNLDQLQKNLAQRRFLHAKLEVERDRLLAPGDLRRRAVTLGLHEAETRQIRHLPAPSSNTLDKQP